MEKPLILTGSSHPELAEKVGKLLGVPAFSAVQKPYPDGEINPLLPESVRGEGDHIYILQPICPPDVNKALVELLFTVSGARRSSADRITAVMPYVGYARGDRQNDKRTTIPISDVLQMIEGRGAHRLVITDLHEEASLGAVTIATDHLHASRVLVPQMREEIERAGSDNIVVAATDQGGAKRVEAYTRLLREQLVPVRDTAYAIQNRHPLTNEKIITGVTGNVEGADVWIVDDIWATGSSIFNAGEAFLKKGARSIRAVVVHGLFLDSKKPGLPFVNAIESLRRSVVEQVLTTDTVFLREDILKASDRIKFVSVSPLLAAAISCIHERVSLTRNLDERLQHYLSTQQQIFLRDGHGFIDLRQNVTPLTA